MAVSYTLTVSELPDFEKIQKYVRLRSFLNFLLNYYRANSGDTNCFLPTLELGVKELFIGRIDDAINNLMSLTEKCRRNFEGFDELKTIYYTFNKGIELRMDKNVLEFFTPRDYDEHEYSITNLAIRRGMIEYFSDHLDVSETASYCALCFFSEYLKKNN